MRCFARSIYRKAAPQPKLWNRTEISQEIKSQLSKLTTNRVDEYQNLSLNLLLDDKQQHGFYLNVLDTFEIYKTGNVALESAQEYTDWYLFPWSSIPFIHGARRIILSMELVGSRSNPWTLSALAYLNVAGADYTFKEKHSSDTVLYLGLEPIYGLDSIIATLKSNNLNLDAHLTKTQLCESHAFMQLIQTLFIQQDGRNIHQEGKLVPESLVIARQTLVALNAFLGEQMYFFGSISTLDLVAYSFISLAAACISNPGLAAMASLEFPALVAFCIRLEKDAFAKPIIKSPNITPTFIQTCHDILSNPLLYAEYVANGFRAKRISTEADRLARFWSTLSVLGSVGFFAWYVGHHQLLNIEWGDIE